MARERKRTYRELEHLGTYLGPYDGRGSAVCGSSASTSRHDTLNTTCPRCLATDEAREAITDDLFDGKGFVQVRETYQGYVLPTHYFYVESLLDPACRNDLRMLCGVPRYGLSWATITRLVTCEECVRRMDDVLKAERVASILRKT